MLHIAQYQFGHISHEVMELVARTLELPVTRVQDVAMFYTMFHEGKISHPGLSYAVVRYSRRKPGGGSSGKQMWRQMR